MPDWLQILVAAAALIGPAVSAWWATRKAAIVAEGRWVRIEETLKALDGRLGTTDTRLNDHARRLRKTELTCAAQHGNGRMALLEAEEVEG